MGLFDSILKEVSKEVTKYKNDIQKEVTNLTGKAFNPTQNSAQQNQTQYSQQSAPANQNFTQPVANSVYPAPIYPKGTDRSAPFDDIISRNFSDCEVYRNVPASSLEPMCHPACTPVSYLFCKGGQPYLAVVHVHTNNYMGMNVLGTKKICSSKGIRYLRFYHEYENAENYVVSRIRSNL